MSNARAPLMLAVFLAFTALLIASADAGIRAGNVSTSIAPSSLVGRKYFAPGGGYRYGGGVTPWGSVRYMHDGEVIPNSEIDLAIVDEDLTVRWRDESYSVESAPVSPCHIAHFVERGSPIAFTIPVAGRDSAYFREHKLRSMGAGYVATEFRSPAEANFLRSVDLATDTEDLPSEIEKQIIQDVYGESDAPEYDEMGSYVNADFHVVYTVHLMNDDGRRWVDIEGLPLRYYWDVGAGGAGLITGVNVFAFPVDGEDSIQYQSILFFQTTALLRQELADDPEGFERLVAEGCPRQPTGSRRTKEGKPGVRH